jgi:RNA polymerase sigma-70 factor (ECF subfamily)
MSGFDLTACLDRVRQNDQEASRLLIAHLYPLVIRIVRSHRLRRVDEEDLAQDVFVKVFTCLPQYQPRDSIPFEHWVSRVAVRTCLDAARFDRRRPEWRHADLSEDELAWLEHLASTDATPAEMPETGARELITKLLDQLAAPDRLVIMLLDLEGKSVREISALTGWSVPGVKVRAFRARRKLRKLAALFGRPTYDE